MTALEQPPVVLLHGGVQVYLAAWLFAIDLEARGITLSLDGETLIARPRSLLSRDDVNRLRTYRHDLKRIVAYEVPEL